MSKLQTGNFTPHPLRVLHLEERLEDAALVRVRLVAEGLLPDITLAQNSADFNTGLEKQSLDLILADWTSAGVDGLEALSRSRRQFPGIPFLFFSGTAGEDAALKALEAGATDFLHKSQVGRLGLAVRRALLEVREREARRQAESSSTTFLKRAEEVVRASERHYRLLFENNPTPIYVYDQTGLVFLAVNQAAVTGYGYSREEFLSMSLNDIALPEEVPVFREKLAHLTAEAGNSGIWRHRRKDGKLIEMEITSHDLNFTEKKAWLSLAMDVTERLSLEAQLRQSQKMESVGQLAGGIAHDFNNLLTVISGHAGLLLAKEALSPQIREPLREISEAAKRAADLTRQLLTFSRKQEIQPQIVDLNEVVNNVGKMLKRILGEDIALEANFSPSLPSVKADLGMLEQVLLNLAVNSRDAMPKGGRLSINTSSEMIDEARAQQNPEAATGRFVRLSFADTGCGIAPENLPRIFEPFFTTKELDRGTGLGLATVYGIIKQHQGWIQVASRLQRGTTFDIFLPACHGRSGAVAMPPTEQRVIGGTETILIVEDEVPLLKLIRHILESHGYKVLESSTGNAALEVWAQHRNKIDLLLTDMVLPDGMTGPELAEILQTSKPGLKVIYTSGYGAEKVAKDFTLGSGLTFLQKPFHARKLAETVFDCLSRN